MTQTRRAQIAWTVGAVLLLSFAAGVTAQETAVPQRPEPLPAEDLSFPPFVEKTLDNGLRVIVIEHHEQPAVSLRLVAAAGSLYDPPELPGLASATASLLTEGTESRTSQEIAEAIDFVGGSLGAGAGTDSTFATAQVTSDQLELGMELLSDILLRPVFAEEEIERWRKQTLSGLQVNLQDPAWLANRAAERLVFGEHPYGSPSSGTPETVKAITREDLMAFHKVRFVPESSILAVVGDVAPKSALEAVEKYFGGWEKGEPRAEPEAEMPKREGVRILVVDKPDAVQTEIRVAQVGVARKDSDYFVAQVYDQVLGGSSSARLFKEVRETRGLSYGAYSLMAGQKQSGLFRAQSYTKTETTVEALEVMLDVIDGLAEKPVPQEELEMRKAALIGSFPLDIETPDGIATKLLDAMVYGYGREYLESYRDKLAAVTADQVQDFARRRIKPGQFVVALVGNASEFLQPLEESFGEPEVVALRELDLLEPDLRRREDAAAEVSEEEREAALAVLRGTLEAHGGEAFVEQRSQMTRGTGRVSAPGMPEPMAVESVVSYRVFPSKERVEMTLPMGPMVQVFNGEQGWVEVMGQVQDQTAQMKEGKEYGFDTLRRFDEPDTAVRLVGEEELGGRPALRVAIIDGEGHATELLIDDETRLVVRADYDFGGQTVAIAFSDYRQVDGVQVPHRVMTTIDGSPMVEMELEEVKVNPEIDESLFAKPEG